MPSSFDREKFRAELLSRGLEWDDDKINAFLEAKQSSTGPSYNPSISEKGWELPSTRIVGPSAPTNEDIDLDFTIGKKASPLDYLENVPRNAALDFVGNMLWEAADLTTFGALGLADEKLNEGDIEQWFTGEEGPTTFAGRAGAGIGGLLGFMGPMMGAKAVAGKAVKHLSSKGTKALNKKMLNEVSSLKGREGIRKLSQEEQSKVFRPFIDNIEQYSKSGMFHSKKGRETYEKAFNKDYKQILAESLDNAGISIRSNTKLEALENIVKRNVGSFNGKNLPVTNLQQQIAVALGSSEGAGKVATIASHALEEAALFAAVETPMELFNSLEEDRPTDFSGTLAHAFTLGSALGLIRMIPGGKQQGVVKEGYRKIFGYTDKATNKRVPGMLSKRRPWASYDVSNPRDRDILVKHVAALNRNGNNGRIFKDLAEDAKDHYGLFLGDIKEVSKLARTPEGAHKIKETLVRIEGDWQKRWAKEWIKEAGQDLYGSTPRMLAGAMAFNHEILFDEDIPTEDKIFNFLIGAYMTKKGRTIEYTAKDGSIQALEFTKRDYTYDQKIKDASMYLDKLGIGYKSNYLDAILQDYKLREEYYGIDESSPDIRSIKNILQKYRVLVPQSDSKNRRPKNPGKEGFHGLYEHINVLADGPLTNSNIRMLRVNEISKKKIAAIENELRETRFESPDSGIIRDKHDVDQVMYKASEQKLIEMHDINLRFLLKGYEGMGGTAIQAKDGSWEFRRIRPDAEALSTPEAELAYKTFLRVNRQLSTSAGKHRVKINPSEDNLVEPTREQIESLIPLLKTAETEANKLIYKDLDPITEGVKLGESTLGAWMEHQSYYKAVRDIHDKLGDLKNTNRKWGEDVTEATEIGTLIKRIFQQDDGFLANELVPSGKNIVMNEKIESSMNFANSVKQFLEVHPNWKTPFGLTVRANSKEVNIKDINDLRTAMSKSGLGGFDLKGQDLTQFVTDIRQFALDRQLSQAKDISGNPINGPQRKQVQFLMERGFVDPQFNIVNIKNLTDSLVKAGIPSYQSSKFRIEKDLGAEKIPVEGLYTNTDGLYEIVDMAPAVREAARLSNMSAADYGKKIVDLYSENIAPLMKLKEGQGFLNPSTTEAYVDGAYLNEIVRVLDVMKYAGDSIKHDALMENVLRLRDAGKPGDMEQILLKEVYQKFFDRRQDTGRLLDILSEGGLWNREKTEFDFTRDNAKQSVQDALTRLRRILPFGENAAKIKRRMEDYIGEKTSESDDIKVVTPVEYRDKYRIDEADVDFIFGDKKDSDRFKTMLDRISILPKGSEERIGYQDFTHDQKMDAVRDTHALLRNYEGTRSVGRLVTSNSAGAIYDSKHTMADNKLFRYLDSTLGEGNFHIVDYNVFTESGVVNARGNKAAKEIILESIADADWAQNKGLKETNEHFGVRYSMVGEGVLFELPNSDWAISISKDALPKLSQTFVQGLDRRIKSPSFKGQYKGVFSELKKLQGRQIEVNTEASIERQEVMYRVDPDVRMMENPNIIGGDGKPQDVWIVRNNPETGSTGLEAAQRQLMNIKSGPGKGTNFAETIDAEGDHYIIRHKKGDHKYIYVEGETPIPQGLIKDTEGRVSGEDYIKTIETPETSYRWKEGTDQQNSQYAGEILTHMFAENTLGHTWYKALEANLGATNPAPMAKLLKRFKLISDVSMYGSNKAQAELLLKHIKPLDGNGDIVKGLDRIVSNGGKLKIAIVKDESFNVEGENDFFSAFRNIKEQLDASLNSNPDLQGKNAKGKLDDIETDYKAKGVEDASMVDSWMPVSKDIMRAIESLAAAGQISDLGGIKPKIHQAANLDGKNVILGKTVFVYDKAFDKFFEGNQNVHAIMFDSAEKANDVDINRIGLKTGDTMESLFAMKNIDSKFIHDIKLEDIELGASVKPHDATLSQQLANDLDINLGNSLYEWAASDALARYETGIARAFNQRDPLEAVAWAKQHNNIPDNFDAMSFYSRMLKFDTIPYNTAMLPALKNNVKKVLIDDGGLLTMKNSKGSVSVLTPGWNLRNSQFWTPKDGKREVYTYGEMELSFSDRGKEIEPSRMHFIKSNEASKDQLLTFEEFNKKHKGIVKNGMTLGQAYDAVKDTRYEIAITSYRSPRTRPGDIVINGLKGFLDSGMGVQAKTNPHDLKHRMEGDFDVDKVNYWWDTPQDLMKKWNDLSGFIPAVAPNKVKNSLDGLDLFKPGSIAEFNESQYNASKMRGQVVKMSRVLQFLENYLTLDADGVTRVVMQPHPNSPYKGRLVLDPKKVEAAKKILAEDIQTIVDSEAGYDKNLFKFNPDGTNEWSKKFLYGGSRDGRYAGLFTWQSGKSVTRKIGKDVKETGIEWSDSKGELDATWGNVAKVSIDALIAPYRGLLQVGSGKFEDGKRTSVTYDDLMDASRRFETRLKFAPKNAIRKLNKMNAGEAVKLMFADGKDAKNFHNPFGQINLKVADPSNMLPFEKVLKKISLDDKSKVSGPGKLFGKKLANFEEWSARY